MPRHTVIPAVHLFLIKDNQILLARRFQTGYEDGNYSVPAGHIEKGETALQAILREGKEEAGIRCSPMQTKFVHVMCRKNPGEEMERVDFFFACTQWDGDLCNPEPEKCDDLRWFPITKLPKNTVAYVRSAINHYQNSIFYSEHGWNV